MIIVIRRNIDKVSGFPDIVFGDICYRFNVPAEIQLYINTLYIDQLFRVFTDNLSLIGFPLKEEYSKMTRLVPSYFSWFQSNH